MLLEQDSAYVPPRPSLEEEQLVVVVAVSVVLRVEAVEACYEADWGSYSVGSGHDPGCDLNCPRKIPYYVFQSGETTWVRIYPSFVDVRLIET